MSSSNKTEFFISIIGILYGLAYLAGIYLNDNHTEGGVFSVQFKVGLLLTIIMPMALHVYRRRSHEIILAPLNKVGIAGRFSRYEPYTYLVFLLSVGFLAGIKPSFAFTFAVWLLLILIQTFAFIFLLHKEERLKLVRTEKYITVLFMVSGFSALIYQVVWQRTLFTTFGVNSESVTVIVSVFMFGLGIGSLAGGYLQKKYPQHLLRIFLLLETSIGVFGLLSLGLIHTMGEISGSPSAASLVIWVYGILALPTLFMGATLPILVEFLQGYFRNIGKTVGLLYAFNTIGSAMAAFITVEVLFVFFGQQTTVLIAAAFNFITAYLIYNASRNLVQINTDPIFRPTECADGGNYVPAHLPYIFIFIILLAIGYISLSQEIIWFRMLGYMTANRPQIFGLLLTAFLIGIAAGSLQSKKICESGKDPYPYLVHALAWATIIFYLSIPLVAEVTALFGKGAGEILAYIAVATVALLTGGILPTLIHLGIEKKQARSTLLVTFLYFANIAGATFGPLITGFLLLDWFTLEENIIILSGLMLLLLLILMLAIPKPLGYKLMGLAAMVTMGLGAWFAHPYLYHGYLEKMQYATTAYKPFKYQLENRSGIITTETSNPDIMYGNGVYDGLFNIDPVSNGNLIDRAYMIAALYRKPSKVLEIGLSTGSWAKVIADYAPLEKMIIVEINKGYPEIVRHYPEIATVLNHPKVTLFFDDGRRWLRNHPGEKFDLIVMNTTYHWRSNVTNLLSVEFLKLCRQHLTPGGVIYYNTTDSKDVVYTAAHVFNYVTMVRNFVAASDSPFDMTVEEKKKNLLNFLDSNKLALFDRDELHRQKLNQLVMQNLEDIGEKMRLQENLWLITDDNMAVEYKNPVFEPTI
jgi:spermidine synthase